MASGWLSARQALWVMVFTGFAVNYMVRINMNIALVAMVEPPRHLQPLRGGNGSTNTPVMTPVGQCAERGPPPPPPSPPTTAALNLSALADDDDPQDSGTEEPDEGARLAPRPERYAWDEHQQGLVLGAFFWLYWLTQVPGGVLAQRYGTKLVFGLGNMLPCVLALFIPAAARTHYSALLVIRLLQGFISGFTWPAMHDMTAKWIPPNERSRFVTSYLGGSVGASITYPACGVIIDWLGWEAVFYITGALGIVWWCAWTMLVYDQPEQHPRIHSAELLHIQKSLAGASGGAAKKKLRTPWRDLLLSWPVWAHIVSQWGALWGLMTLMTQAPSYFRYIHGWSIQMTGLLSGVPQLCRMIFAMVFSFIGDHLLKNEIMSRTNVRKLATAMCNIGQGLFVLGLAFSGCNYLAAIFCLTAATAANGAVTAGALASMVDISPNFASIIFGINGVVTVLPGFISPIVVGALTFQNQRVERWQIVYGITAGMLFVTGLIFVLFGQSEVQPWNEPADEDEDSKKDAAKSVAPLSPRHSQEQELRPVC